MGASAGKLLCFYLPDPEQMVHHCPLPSSCPKCTPECLTNPFQTHFKIQHKHTPSQGKLRHGEVAPSLKTPEQGTAAVQVPGAQGKPQGSPGPGRPSPARALAAPREAPHCVLGP